MTIDLLKKDITQYINKREIFVSLTACGVIVFSPGLSLFNGILRLFFTPPFKLDTIFIYGVFFLLIMFSIKTILVRSSPFTFGIIAFLLINYLTAFMVNVNYDDYYYIRFGIDFLIESAPWLFVAYAVRDYKLFKKYLFYSAIIIMISAIMNVYVFKTDIYGDKSYSQSYTYVMLPTAIIICSSFFERVRWFNIIFFATSIIFMLSMGSRGPLLCVVLYVLLKLTLIYKLKAKKAMLISVIFVSVIVPLYVFFYDILNYFLTIFQNLNLSTRTIMGLIEGSFFEDNARNLLSEYSINLISEHALLGLGIGTDRIVLANKMQISVVAETIGWYPHNIFLELLLHFGIFIGGAIIVYMFMIIYTTIFRNFDKDAADVICIFIGIGLVPLFASGSYITKPLFFALCGFCLFQYKKIQVEKNEKENGEIYK
jgi:hypothetical protein